MNEKKKIFYGWWIVAGMVLILATIVPLVMALSNKYLIPVTQDMGISRSSFSLINMISQIPGILLSPFIAKKMAEGNMKKILGIGVIGFAISYASYSLAQNEYYLYISSIFVGIFFLCTTMIPASMMVTNWFVEKRGLAMSLTMTGVGLGGFIFSPVVTYLIEGYGWRTTYLIMAVVVLVIGLPIVLFVLQKKPEDKGLQPYGAENRKKANETGKGTEKCVTISVKESRSKTFFILLIIGMFLCGIVNGGALGQFPPAIQEMHGVAVQATIISLYSLIGIFGKITIGWLNDKFGTMVSSLFGCVAFALVFVFMLMGDNVSMLYVMALCFGLGMGIGNVSPALIVSDIFGSEKYGESYGIANSSLQVGLALGSLTVAFMYDNFGSYNSAWILMFALTCITLLCWAGALKISRRYFAK